MQGWQYSFEGLRTLLLLFKGRAAQVGSASTAEALGDASFALALVALGLPLVIKGYDALVVQAITLHRNGKPSCRPNEPAIHNRAGA